MIANSFSKEKSVLKTLSLLFNSEHSGDALRNTSVIVLLGLIVFYFSSLESGIVVGVGALLSSLTDLPGNKNDKWKSARWCIPLFWISSFVTASILTSSWILVIWLIVAAFVFMMLSIYGVHIGVVGLMTLILVTFTIGLSPSHGFLYSVQITFGAIIYYLISLTQAHLVPYRSLNFALSDSFHSTAGLLRAKSRCYDENVPVEKCYQELATWHIQVSERHEMLRYLLLKDSKLANASSNQYAYWLKQVIGLTDLYELMVALDHDYEHIRKILLPTNALSDIRKLIILVAEDLEGLSYHDDNKQCFSTPDNTEVQIILNKLEKTRENAFGEETVVLDGIIRNVQQILSCIDQIKSSFYSKADKPEWGDKEVIADFISIPSIKWKSLRSYFSLKVTTFSFALRIAVLFSVGSLIGLMLPENEYWYWILLTLVLVSKPTFANTKRRNFQRILGTFGGVALGFILVYLGGSGEVLLLIAAIFLYGFFLFNRTNYAISVLLLTAGILIALHLYGGNILNILSDRIVFTLLGSCLAFAGWFFIPVKQSKGLLILIDEVIQKSSAYLAIVKNKADNEFVSIKDLRLARKNAHTVLAAFSDGFQQLQQEPGHKKMQWENIHHFHTLAYRINSLTIGLSLSVSNDDKDGLEYLEKLMDELSTLSEHIFIPKQTITA